MMMDQSTIFWLELGTITVYNPGSNNSPVRSTCLSAFVRSAVVTGSLPIYVDFSRYIPPSVHRRGRVYNRPHRGTAALRHIFQGFPLRVSWKPSFYGAVSSPSCLLGTTTQCVDVEREEPHLETAASLQHRPSSPNTLPFAERCLAWVSSEPRRQV